MLGYPISISPDGSLSESGDDTRDMILSLLDCLFYERVLLPDFGVSIPVFDPADSGSMGTLIVQLQLAIDYWIGGGVQVLPGGFSDGSPELGTLEVTIVYPGQLTPFTYRLPN